MFALWVTARPGVHIETLEAATLAEVDRLAADGPTAADLERVSERADRLSMYTCLFDEPERINEETSRWEAVDAGRVSEALQASLRPDNRVTLTYVPAEAAS
jgi:hypothetical protein